jgi:threonine/homoserine/homoserine lactone efflux protein
VTGRPDPRPAQWLRCGGAGAGRLTGVITSAAALGIVLLALALVLTPGPNMMYLVSRTLTQGRRAGLISLAGVALGFLIYLTATNLGLAAVFVAVPDLYLAIRVAGCCYLGWLAFKTLRPGGISVFEPVPVAGAKTDSTRRLFAMGLTTNLLNPKVAVLYLSLIPQFERPARGHLVAQGFELGLLQICVALIGNLSILLAAAEISRVLRRRPSWLRMQRFVMGSVLGLLAIKLATDRARPVGV